jgi:putative transposase
MKYELSHSAHSVHTLQYHFVQCVKYRRNALVNPLIVDLLKKTIKDISSRFDVEVLNIEADKNHFHLLFRSKPTLEMSKYINAIKTISSREIRRNFPEVLKLLWRDAFWSQSYFLATTGQVTLDTLKKYVDNQGKVKND